jgi:transposase
MAYRYGDRKQETLFPQSIDEYIPEDAPVRAYDAFVEALGLEQTGIQLEPHKVGCPQYDPKVMLKLLVYGYSYGVRSSRKLERETHYNLSFIWLTGGLKPDHKTIAEFRRRNRSALKKVLRQCARLCMELGLIEGNTLFVDGTKIRANASIKNTWTKERCKKHLKNIDKRIKQILSECESVDRSEKDQGSLVELCDQLKGQAALKTKIKEILMTIKKEGCRSTNTTDPDCTKVRSKQGSHAGYNAQMVVDEKYGLIVSGDVVNENNDLHQFANQVEQANETLEKKCKTACADAGYASVDELEKIDSQGIKVVVPSQKQAIRVKKANSFDKSNFRYDRKNDCYICPEGHALTYRRTEPEKRRRVYRVKRSVCQQCCYFGLCTTGKIGRKLTRLLKEDLKQKLEAQYEQPKSQEVYRLRKQKVELPFGHIKYNLKAGGFLLRGLDGVKAEASLLASCFNIARMISIIGVSGLIARLTS